jgi:hypothetical protein
MTWPEVTMFNFENIGFTSHGHNLTYAAKMKCAGKYLQAEVDGKFDRDILEFLVKGDVVAYRCMAAKVTYVYPFTTAFGDSKGQEEKLKQINDQLGWFAPSFDSME